MSGPRRPAPDNDTAHLGVYINDAAALITARVADLADTAVRYRPPWMSPLGQQPADPDRARDWLRHVAVISAYRDQHKVTADDPRQVLGPYAEPDHTGHDACRHAAESVLAARQAAGLENGTSTPGPGGQATAQLAADIYRALPDSEREAIANAMVAMPGTGWLGGPGRTDEHIAVHAAFAGVLTATLIRYGHLTVAAEPADDIPSKERPLEADFARQIASKRGRSVAGKRKGPEATTRAAGPACSGVSEGSAPRPSMTRSGITHLIS